MQDLGLEGHRRHRAAELQASVVGEDEVEQHIALVRGARGRRLEGEPPVQHQRAQRHVSQQMAAVGVLEDAVPAVALELADVVEEDAREYQVGVGAAYFGDGARDRRNFGGVLDQPADRGVVAVDTRRAAAVARPELVVVVEQAEDASEAGFVDLPAPAVEDVPVPADIAHGRQQLVQVHGARGEQAERGGHAQLAAAAVLGRRHDRRRQGRAGEPAGGIPECEDRIGAAVETLLLGIQDEQRVLHAVADLQRSQVQDAGHATNLPEGVGKWGRGCCGA